jgi:hypothetical protein
VEAEATKWLFRMREQSADSTVQAAGTTTDVLKISSFRATKPQTHKALVDTLID